MAAQSVTPIVEKITLKEGVAMLFDTGYRVSEDKLRDLLKKGGYKPERHGITDYFRIADVWAAHRDYVYAKRGIAVR